MQQKDRYTVVNLAMGSWIAVQQFIGLQLWGARFDPDWVVVMDGFNDAAVGCAHSQGIGNPMYSAAMRTLVHAYMFSSARPDFYRGWLENQLVAHSAAYRALTGKRYIPFDATFDPGSAEVVSARRQIVPTKVAAARDILAFYLAAEQATLKLFPSARYIFSTQPTVNVFRGDFVDIYDHPPGSAEREQAMARQEADLEIYLKANEHSDCGVKAQAPSFTYVFGNGAVHLERWAAEQTRRGRYVGYHNIGTLLPPEREDRKPFFVDPAHLSDRGQDLIGQFFAERILSAD